MHNLDCKMDKKKFDPKKLEKLNNLKRLKDIPPDYVLGKLNMEKANILVEIGAGTVFFSIISRSAGTGVNRPFFLMMIIRHIST